MKTVLAGALLFVLCAASALAGVSLLYYVGYGLYPYCEIDTTSTAPGTGLLANNGSGRALVQLIYAGSDTVAGSVDLNNPLAGYVAGDDVVWQSTVIEAGDRFDEWGFSNIPLAYTNLAWATAGFIFVRVFQDDTPQYGEGFYDTPLLALNTANLTDGIFSQWLSIGTATEGVYLHEIIGGPIPGPNPDPDPSPNIRPSDLDSEGPGFTFGVPDYFYELRAVYGANATLPSGGWNWQPLAEGTDFTVGTVVGHGKVITFPTAGEGRPGFRLIRIGLLPRP